MVSTPGRTKALVLKKKLDLSHVKHFVLDECDRMLEEIGNVAWPTSLPRYLATVAVVQTRSSDLGSSAPILMGRFGSIETEHLDAYAARAGGRAHVPRPASPRWLTSSRFVFC